ncbi:MAG: glycosyltransferase family 4 protein [Flavobacteriales bacterium]|nr:glycosyltransferase family 4 protein [Flavobacteriales bacterium]
MKIIIWQNIISAHQSFLIRVLADRHDVTLAVLQNISDERQKQGWTIPDTGKAKIVWLKSKAEGFNLYRNNEKAIHIFSGIATYYILKDVFKRINKNSVVGVIVEAGSPLGWQKYFRKMLYALKYVKHNAKIDFIFAMGDLGVNWYSSVGFSKSKLIKFQYFTELPYLETLKEKNSEDKPKLVFIGQLIDRKNIQDLIIALINLKALKYDFVVIGNGPLKRQLQEIVKQNNVDDKIKFLGNVNNSDAMDILANSDYLILPSKFDGWGAVINESLSRGVKVLTNENCGASCLVREMNWGTVYNKNTINGLQDALHTILINFKKDSLASRKLTAAKFADYYSYRVVANFEQVLLNHKNQ